VADLIILAKTTEEITGTEKDRTRAVSPHEGRFFSEMRIVTGDFGLSARAAETRLPLQSIDPTVSWTKLATLEEMKGFLHAQGKLSGMIQFQIGRFHDPRSS
jgi:hypothetical protein